MLPEYKKLISETDDLEEIAAAVILDGAFRKGVESYCRHMHDAEFSTVAGTFRMAYASVPVDRCQDRPDEETDNYATVEAGARLACCGARYVASEMSGDRVEVLGIMRNPDPEVKMCFSKKGETIYLAGCNEGGADIECVLSAIEKAVCRKNVITAHVISPSGCLFAALVESACPNRLGFDITTDSEMDEKEFLFGNCGYIALLTVDDSTEDDFVDMMYNAGVRLTLVGHVTKGEMRVDDESYGMVSDLF